MAWAQALVAIPPLDSPVVDTTGTLDPAQRRQLTRQALDLQQRKGSQLQVLMVASTQPETIEQYTQRAFDQWKLGRQDVDDAVLVVVAKNDRRVRIQPGYGLEGAIPDITAGRVIQEYMAPRFRQGDYGGGLIDATAVLARLIEGETLPAPIAAHSADHRAGGDGGGEWMFALLAAFMVASVARGVFGRLPGLLRGMLTGGAAGAVAWLLSSLFGLGLAVALVGFFFGLARAST
ncbi:MAG: TPM domain-containing protein, partial [Pseudomonadota bacterium]|nr:TPM domain-containing protein [Pseudomonadota bacterium]